MGDVIEISVEDYNEFVSDSNFLSALMAAGVDNWEGYDTAVEIYNGEDN